MTRNLAQKVAYNVGTQAAGKVVALVLSLIAIRLMTEYLGVDRYGQLAIVLTFVGLVVIVSELGISTVLAREVAKSPERADELGGTLFRFRLLSAGIAVGIALAATPFLPYGPQVKLGLVIGLVGAFFQSIGRFPHTFFQVRLRMDVTAFLESSYRLAIVLLVVMVAALDLGFYAVLTALTLAAFVWCLTSFVLSRRFWTINVRTIPGASRPLIRDSFGLWLFTVFGLLHLQGDMLLLSFMKPPADVAIYTIAFKFIEQALVLSGLLMAVFFPILVRRMNESKDRGEEVIRRCSALLLVAAVCLTLIFVVMAPQLVSIIASDEFADAAQALRILALALPAMFAAAVYLHVLVALNKQRALIGIALSSLALNVALNLYLIPHYSYIGAAWATVASELFASGAVVYMAWRAFGFRLEYGLASRISFPALLAVAVVVTMHSLPPPAVAAGAIAVFLGGILATKVITRGDFRLVVGR
jgi:O-antigen/teichoic acid export membrane protein